MRLLLCLWTSVHLSSTKGPRKPGAMRVAGGGQKQRSVSCGPTLVAKEWESRSIYRDVRAGRKKSGLTQASPNSQDSITSKPNKWLMNSNSSFYSQLRYFMLGCQITVFYYFVSLLCILFISVVLPTFWHFFKSPTCSCLPFVFLVKAPIAVMYLSQPSAKFPVVFLPQCWLC